MSGHTLDSLTWADVHAVAINQQGRRGRAWRFCDALLWTIIYREAVEENDAAIAAYAMHCITLRLTATEIVELLRHSAGRSNTPAHASKKKRIEQRDSALSRAFAFLKARSKEKYTVEGFLKDLKSNAIIGRLTTADYPDVAVFEAATKDMKIPKRRQLSDIVHEE